MSIVRSAVLASMVCMFLAGCATTKNAFVLVPDPEGKLGSVTITNPKGSSTISGDRETVLVDNAASAPRSGGAMEPARIAKTFGAALAAEPPTPKVFLLYFKTDSAEPDVDSMKLLDVIVQEIKTRNSLDIGITGHADRTGKSEYNMELSMKRAQSVQRLLVERGVPAERITIAYSGDGDPLVPTAANVAEPRNRRVEVVVR